MSSLGLVLVGAVALAAPAEPVEWEPEVMESADASSSPTSSVPAGVVPAGRPASPVPAAAPADDRAPAEAPAPAAIDEVERPGPARSPAVAFREVGLEILTREHNFGFKILARPWLEAGRVAIEGDPLATVGGGVLVSLGIAGYRLGF